MKSKLILYTTGFVAFVYFFGLYFDYTWLRVFTKPLPILLLLLLIDRSNKYNRLIMFGFVFSALGDLFLELPYELFVAGLLSFLVAHIFYTIAFWQRSKSVCILAASVLIAIGAGNYWMLFPQLAEMAVPVAVYMSIILIMLWRAYAQKNTAPYAGYAFWGALVFVLSDTFIAYNRFYTEIAYAQWYIMVLYWTAQVLIFVSAYRNKTA